MTHSSGILLIIAHPDDEVLGCGGTVAKFSEEGNEVYTLILGEGITSRDEKREPKTRKVELEALREDALMANRLLGVKKVIFCDFPDNRFDSVPLLDIVKTVEKVIEEIKPEIIFTHHGGDLNIDHQITYRAVLTATRPQPGSSVKEIYSCEVLSSTEWAYPVSFQPDTYFTLSEKHIRKKIEAMQCYRSELRQYPHPRSIEGIEYLAKLRGMQVGCEYAEGFKLVRKIL
ncbi:MAG: PIG-L family deacetylase [Aquificaceae bacterium]|jgi:LmbE family N-acetylglucosaminyl deacetylase|uniref:PIG-L deacetylase family protein n=1 Tax=Hydrogenobacter sp. Uz 6-8 TaxID=3384828 RepID=UPI003094E3AF